MNYALSWFVFLLNCLALQWGFFLSVRVSALRVSRSGYICDRFILGSFYDNLGSAACLGFFVNVMVMDSNG